MEVIFIKDLKGQGKKGETKTVKDGYGINYLIKNNYAIPANEGNLKHLAHEQAEISKEEESKRKEYNSLKTKLEKETLKFQVKVGEKDKVFGSVSAKQISSLLQKKGYSILKKDIQLDESLTKLGKYIVKIELYRDIKANLKIELIK